jgi:hypothetical protein
MAKSKQFHQLEHEASSFAEDDFIAIDGQSNDTRKMSAGNLVGIMAQNAIAGNIASGFDQSESYEKDKVVAYEGKLYKFNKPHKGPWNVDDVDPYMLDEEVATEPIEDETIEDMFDDI